MSEHAVFVPFGEERIAAIVTVPEGRPRGLVMLLCGIGAPRSHRFQLWPRLARRLASEGLAVVRMDYLGIGDSTSATSAWTFEDLPLEDVRTVARFGMDAAGVDRFAIAGNCLGSHIGLTLAGTDEACLGAACIRMPMLDRGGAKLRRRARRWKLASLVRSNRLLRGALNPVAAATRERTIRPEVRETFVRAVQRAKLLFLYSEVDGTYDAVIKRDLDQIIARMPSDPRGSYELQVLPGSALKGLESLLIQDLLIEALAEWLPRCFDPESAAALRA